MRLCSARRWTPFILEQRPAMKIIACAASIARHVASIGSREATNAQIVISIRAAHAKISGDSAKSADCYGDCATLVSIRIGKGLLSRSGSSEASLPSAALVILDILDDATNSPDRRLWNLPSKVGAESLGRFSTPNLEWLRRYKLPNNSFACHPADLFRNPKWNWPKRATRLLC